MTEFEFESGYAFYKLYDGLFIISIKADQIIDKQTIHSINEKKNELLREKSYPTLIVIKDNFLFSEKDGFMEFITGSAIKRSTAIAIVIQSPLRRILTAFNYIFYESKVPFRVFAKTSSAKLWLFSYIEETELLTEEL